MKIPTASALILLLLGLSYAATDVFAKNETREKTEARPLKVLELFTSQGCSSCPPADRLLGELAQASDVIAISCHVTYWNYLGWQDSFSLKYCDQRQRFYQNALDFHSRYTPQLVVNGTLEAVGSQRSRVERALHSDELASPLPINIQMQDDEILIDFSNLKSLQRLKIDLLGISAKNSVEIKRGENRGRKIAYSNTLRKVIPINPDNIKNNQLRLKKPESNLIDAWLVIANDKRSGKVIGLGKRSLSF